MSSRRRFEGSFNLNTFEDDDRLGFSFHTESSSPRKVHRYHSDLRGSPPSSLIGARLRLDPHRDSTDRFELPSQSKRGGGRRGGGDGGVRGGGGEARYENINPYSRDDYGEDEDDHNNVRYQSRSRRPSHPQRSRDANKSNPPSSSRGGPLLPSLPQLPQINFPSTMPQQSSPSSSTNRSFRAPQPSTYRPLQHQQHQHQYRHPPAPVQLDALMPPSSNSNIPPAVVAAHTGAFQSHPHLSSFPSYSSSSSHPSVSSHPAVDPSVSLPLVTPSEVAECRAFLTAPFCRLIRSTSTQQRTDIDRRNLQHELDENSIRRILQIGPTSFHTMTHLHSFQRCSYRFWREDDSISIVEQLVALHDALLRSVTLRSKMVEFLLDTEQCSLFNLASHPMLVTPESIQQLIERVAEACLTSNGQGGGDGVDADGGDIDRTANSIELEKRILDALYQLNHRSADMKLQHFNQLGDAIIADMRGESIPTPHVVSPQHPPSISSPSSPSLVSHPRPPPTAVSAFLNGQQRQRQSTATTPNNVHKLETKQQPTGFHQQQKEAQPSQQQQQQQQQQHMKPSPPPPPKPQHSQPVPSIVPHNSDPTLIDSIDEYQPPSSSTRTSSSTRSPLRHPPSSSSSTRTNSIRPSPPSQKSSSNSPRKSPSTMTMTNVTSTTPTRIDESKSPLKYHKDESPSKMNVRGNILETTRESMLVDQVLEQQLRIAALEAALLKEKETNMTKNKVGDTNDEKTTTVTTTDPTIDAPPPPTPPTTVLTDKSPTLPPPIDLSGLALTSQVSNLSIRVEQHPPSSDIDIDPSNIDRKEEPSSSSSHDSTYGSFIPTLERSDHDTLATVLANSRLFSRSTALELHFTSRELDVMVWLCGGGRRFVKDLQQTLKMERIEEIEKLPLTTYIDQNTSTTSSSSSSSFSHISLRPLILDGVGLKRCCSILHSYDVIERRKFHYVSDLIPELRHTIEEMIQRGELQRPPPTFVQLLTFAMENNHVNNDVPMTPKNVTTVNNNMVDYNIDIVASPMSSHSSPMTFDAPAAWTTSTNTKDHTYESSSSPSASIPPPPPSSSSPLFGVPTPLFVSPLDRKMIRLHLSLHGSSIFSSEFVSTGALNLPVNDHSINDHEIDTFIQRCGGGSVTGTIRTIDSMKERREKWRDFEEAIHNFKQPLDNIKE